MRVFSGRGRPRAVYKSPDWERIPCLEPRRQPPPAPAGDSPGGVPAAMTARAGGRGAASGAAATLPALEGAETTLVADLTPGGEIVLRYGADESGQDWARGARELHPRRLHLGPGRRGLRRRPGRRRPPPRRGRVAHPPPPDARLVAGPGRGLRRGRLRRARSAEPGRAGETGTGPGVAAATRALRPADGRRGVVHGLPEDPRPCRMDFSRAAARIMPSGGSATSMSFSADAGLVSCQRYRVARSCAGRAGGTTSPNRGLRQILGEVLSFLVVRLDPNG